MKHCHTCKTDKPFTFFSSHSETKDRLYPLCKECKKAYDKQKYEANKEQKKSKRKEHYENNKLQTRLKQKDYYTNNKEIFVASSAKRRALKEQATPKWASTKEIQSFYNLASYFTWVSGGFVKYHVDHIVPLKGKEVCGLHVQNNLQILKSVDNLRKSNKYECNI